MAAATIYKLPPQSWEVQGWMQSRAGGTQRGAGGGGGVGLDTAGGGGMWPDAVQQQCRAVGGGSRHHVQASLPPTPHFWGAAVAQGDG